MGIPPKPKRPESIVSHDAKISKLQPRMETELSLMEQGALLTGVRGNDVLLEYSAGPRINGKRGSPSWAPSAVERQTLHDRLHRSALELLPQGSQGSILSSQA